MSIKTKKVILIAFLLIGISLNYFFDSISNQSRHLASDDNSKYLEMDLYDLSQSTGKTFQKAFKYQTLKNALIKKTPQDSEIQIGLFLIQDNEGKAVPMCEKYPTIDFVFSADGIAISGKSPTIILRVPCIVDFDNKHTAAFRIPFTDIFNGPLHPETLKVSNSVNQEQGSLFIYNESSEWPQDWIWTGLKLYSKDGEILSVNGYEIISVIGEPPYIREFQP